MNNQGNRVKREPASEPNFVSSPPSFREESEKAGKPAQIVSLPFTRLPWINN